MSDREQNPMEDDLLDRATAGLRDADVPPGPSEALLNDTLARLSAEEHAPRVATHSRRFWSMKTVAKYAVAACVLIAAGVLAFVLPAQRSSLVFGDVLKKVQDANAIRFKIVTTVDLPDTGKQIVEGEVLCTSSRMRQTMKGMTSIVDFQKGEIIQLQVSQKQAMRLKTSNLPPQAKVTNLLSSFRSLKADQGKDLGTVVVAGKKLHVFEVVNQQQYMKVWADPKDGLPVKIESKIDMAMVPRAEAIMTDFDWNVAEGVADEMLEVPAGYMVKDFSYDGSPATEKDLIETLHAFTAGNDGKFPDDLNFAAVVDTLKRQFANMPKPSTASTHPSLNDIPPDMMDKAMHITRGLAFIVPKNGTDWHYAGKGNSMTDGDAKPILWYLPTGATKYRVIDSRLHGTEVAKDALPTVDSVSLGNGLMSPAATKPAK